MGALHSLFIFNRPLEALLTMESKPDGNGARMLGARLRRREVQARRDKLYAGTVAAVFVGLAIYAGYKMPVAAIPATGVALAFGVLAHRHRQCERFHILHTDMLLMQGPEQAVKSLQQIANS